MRFSHPDAPAIVREALATCTEEIGPEAYADLLRHQRSNVVEGAGAFVGVWRSDRVAVARLHTAASGTGLLQVGLAVLLAPLLRDTNAGPLLLVAGIGRLELGDVPAGPVDGWCHAAVEREGPGAWSGQLAVLTAAASLVVAREVRLRTAEVADLFAADAVEQDGGDDEMIEQSAGGLVRRLARAAEAQRPAVLREFVVRRVRAILEVGGATELDVASPLSDQGFDSLMVAQLTRELAFALAQRIAPTLVLTHNSVDALVAHLGGRVAATVAASAKGEPR